MFLRADALVVVDVQHALVRGDNAVEDAAGHLHRWVAALRSARAAGAPVIHLQDEGADPGSLIPCGSMCVAATARGAMARGLTVVLPRDAHTTYAVPADGSAPAVPAAHVSRVAEWSLGDELVAPDRLADVRFSRPPGQAG